MDIRQSIAGIFATSQTGYQFAGTGFLVAGGFIITCAHVIDSANLPGGIVSLKFEGNRRIHTAQVVRQSPKEELDIAVLRLSVEPDIPFLPLAFSSHGRGNRFSVFGYPQKGDFIGLHGIGEILGLVQDKRGRDALQISSRQVTHGYSGGPIWDERLKAVVGMVRGGYDDGLDEKLGDIAFAIPTEVLKKFFPELTVEIRHSDTILPDLLDDMVLRSYLEKQSNIEFKDKIVDQNIVPIFIREIDSAGIREKPSNPVEFIEFRDDMLFSKQKNVIIVGEAGIGKTTELLRITKHLSSQFFQDGKAATVPVYIELRRFSSKSGSADDVVLHMMREIGIPGDHRDQLTLALKKTKQFLIIFDGLNEIGSEHRLSSVDALLEFTQIYSNLQYILSTRYYGFDDRFVNIIGISMNCYEIQRWDQRQVELFFQMNDALLLYGKLEVKVQKLCSVPFAAHLLLNVLKSSHQALSRQYPQNKGELYKSYVEYVFTKRDSKISNKFASADKISLLAEIAFFMNRSGNLSLKYKEIQVGINSTEIDIINVIREVVRNGILKQADEYFLKELISESPIEFVHQSLQEYFTAVYISTKPVNEVINYLPMDSIDNVYWRDVPIYLVGLLDDPLSFINLLLTHPKRDDYLLLASQCLVSCQSQPSQYEEMLHKIIEEFLINAIQESRYTKDAVEIVDVLGADAIEILLRHLDEVDEMVEVRALTGDEKIERKWRKYGRIIYILGELNVRSLAAKLGKVFKKVKDTHLLYHIVIALYSMKSDESSFLLQDAYLRNHRDPVVRAFSIMASLRLYPDDVELNRAKIDLISALIENLNNFDDMAFAIRAHSAEAIGLLGSKDAVQPLANLLKVETRSEPQSSAIKALGYIAFKYEQEEIDSEIVDILIEILENGSVHANQWAQKLLRELLRSLCTKDDAEKLNTATQRIDRQEVDLFIKKSKKEILEDIIFSLKH